MIFLEFTQTIVGIDLNEDKEIQNSLGGGGHVEIRKLWLYLHNDIFSII